MVEYDAIPAKGQSRLDQFGKKVLPGKILGKALVARGIWEGDALIADIEELGKLDASEIPARRLSAKEILTSQKGEKFPIPIHRRRTRLTVTNT